MAVAKRHGRGPHLINRRIDAGGTRELLNLPLVWKTIEALAQFIKDNYEGDGCYGDVFLSPRMEGIALLG
jgi:hypothetical protein